MTDSGALSRRAWGVLLVLCGALFLDALDVSMIGVALPSIRTDLGMSTNSLQWVVSTYVLGYGGFLLLGAAPPTSSVAAGCSCSRWRSFSSPRAWVGWRRTPRS
jgi:MFS family permease